MSITDQSGRKIQEFDLEKLGGIGPMYRAILEEIGVASIKELRHRNPARLKEMIKERYGAVGELSERQMETWIDEAKAFQEQHPA